MFEAQGNIIFKDILRKRRAPQDLICMASVLGKLKTSLLYYLRDQNHAMDTYVIQWRTAKCLPVRKIFLVFFSTVVSKIQFFMPVVISNTNASPNCKDQYLPKKRSRTNKRTALKKTCLFSGLSKELDLT